ncbi:MAG: T9SS type A sorting domain-containing protein [Bacteroidia bacterium]
MNPVHRKLTYLLSLIALLSLGEISMAQRIPGTWEQKASMGSGRFWAFSCAANGKVYGGTGRTAFSGNTIGDFWEYDVATDTWTQKADFPGGVREGADGFSVNGRIFAGFGTPFIAFNSDLYEYIPATDTWETRASVPGGVGFAYSHGFVIDSMYYMGPENGTNKMYAYNVNTDIWTQVADFPGKDRRAQVAFTAAGKGYIGLGFWVFGSVQGDFFAYDPVTDTWAEVAGLLPKSDQSTGFGIGEFGYVHNVGGNQKDTYRYDPSKDEWFFEVNHPGDRIANATSCVLDSNAYLVFGERTISGGNSASDQIWKFTPGRDTTNSTAISREQYAPKVFLGTTMEGNLSVDISGENLAQTTTVILSDLSGRRLISGQMNIPGNTTFETAGLASGLYLVSLYASGYPVYTQKWMKP